MTSLVEQALAAIETTPDLIGLTHAKILGAEVRRLRADPDRYAGECLRGWQKDRGDCDVTIRGLDVSLRPKTWRLALALRLSSLEADRDRVLALHSDASRQAELRALREKLDVATKHSEQLAKERDEEIRKRIDAEVKLTELRALMLHGRCEVSEAHGEMRTLARLLVRDLTCVVVELRDGTRTVEEAVRAMRFMIQAYGGYEKQPGTRMVGVDRASVEKPVEVTRCPHGVRIMDSNDRCYLCSGPCL